MSLQKRDGRLACAGRVALARLRTPAASKATRVALLLLALLLPLAACSPSVPAATSTPSAIPGGTPMSTSGVCASQGCALGPGLGSAQLIVEPDDGIRPFTSVIASATKSLAITMYLLTDARIIQGLEEAAARGVDVRMLLEMHPLGENPTGAQKTFDTLAAAGVHMKAADPAYTLTHEKAMIVDSATLYVMTCNLTKSALGGSSAATNRDYAVVDTGAEDVREAQAIFQADWDRTTPQVGDANLLVSPANSRAKLTALIAAASSSLLLDQEEVYDAGMEDALIGAAKRGIAVRVILPPSSSSDASQRQDIARLVQGSVHVAYSTKLYMHAKIIVADGSRAFVGSENFSAQSLDSNRELGVVVADPTVLARLTATFTSDWSTAQAA